MKRILYSGLGLLLIAVAFLLFNGLSGALLSGARLDLTEQKLYTLSPGTRQILASLDSKQQALLLCRRLFGISLPSHIAAALNKRAAVRWLESVALSAMTAGGAERDPHDARFGTTLGSLSTFLLNPSWRYRLAELKIHLTNQNDVLTVALPHRLRFLYPILRLPFWVWRHTVRHGPHR